MPRLKPRSRVVVFRLTQQEYEAIRILCTMRGGRTLSGFARAQLLQLLERERQAEVDQKLAALQSSVARMERLLEDLTRRRARKEGAE